MGIYTNAQKLINETVKNLDEYRTLIGKTTGKAGENEPGLKMMLSLIHISMDPRNFQYRDKKILRRAGVGYANAHTLRHTFSVRALEAGFDIKTLSEILGHADASVTMKTYAHSLDEHKRTSMELLGSFRSREAILRQDHGHSGAGPAL